MKRETPLPATRTADQKARDLYDTGDPRALHHYLERWRDGLETCGVSYVLNVVHAFVLIQAHATQSDITVGSLTLKLGSHRIHWMGVDPVLTISEFKVVKLLVDHLGDFVSYRSIYDVVQSPGFAAGEGSYGYRGNVRSLVKRMRKKFLAIDPGFRAIQNFCGHGYRWIKPDPEFIEVPVLVPVRMPEGEQHDVQAEIRGG